jgi:tetratricopeptide (TPR) repeat protein
LADGWKVFGICLFLVAVIWVVFGQTAHFDFVNYDDQCYVYENPVVQKGLTWNGALWALTYGGIGHWHPLTWLTHMADCQVYGLWAGGHHLTNVALHAATTVLLFLVLRAMTGALWRSAFVAAVFAVHPLRAESVAWIAERKDVLSGMFFMLTLWAYVRYARQPSRGRYAAVALLFGLGLLSKNMLVTLPFVLLLLDWWPLGRMGGRQNLEFRIENGESVGKKAARMAFWGLVREKIPLLLLSAGSCVATACVSEKVTALTHIPALDRFANALVSYVVYVGQMLFPAGLAIPYLFAAGGKPIWQVCVAFVLLAATSAGVMACRKKSPCMVMGWLWYLGMLVPVIGLVQISYYTHADRYTYLPGIGLCMAGTWAVGDWSAGWKHRRVVLGGLMVAVIGALTLCGHRQASYWRENESLWTRSLACSPRNVVAHNGMGQVLYQRGDLDGAIAQYRKALEIRPAYKDAHFNLGIALSEKGDLDEAIAQYGKALEVTPDDASAHNSLGACYEKEGRLEDAIAQYKQAVEIKPDYWDAHFNMGVVLLKKEDTDGAIAEYKKAVEINSEQMEAHLGLGNALALKGDLVEAIAQYQQALLIAPDDADTRYNLANTLVQYGKLDDAVAQYRKALEIKPDYLQARSNLGNTLKLQGDLDGAIEEYRKVLALNPAYEKARYNVALALLAKGDLEEAIVGFQQALKINPRSADACADLGLALFKKGRTKEAIDAWQQALEIKPDQLQVLNNLAWLLATTPDGSLRDGAKAVALAAQANQLTGGGNPMMLHTLAAAYAEEGNYGLGAVTARRGLDLALRQKNDTLAATLQKEIKLYDAGRPARESATQASAPTAPAAPR